MTCLLCPVPAVHVPSALETCAREGRVAFGSSAVDVLLPLSSAVDTRVWIAASSTDAPKDGVPGVEIGKVVLMGRLVSITPAIRRGAHPNPELRPVSTRTDNESTFRLYWEVSDLERIHPAQLISSFRAQSGRFLTKVPHGPTRIICPEGF